MPQALTLDEQPVLEGRVANADAVEEIAAVELRCLLNGLRRPIDEQPLEGGDVAGHGGWVELDRLAVGDDRRRHGRFEALTDSG